MKIEKLNELVIPYFNGVDQNLSEDYIWSLDGRYIHTLTDKEVTIVRALYMQGRKAGVSIKAKDAKALDRFAKMDSSVVLGHFKDHHTFKIEIYEI